MTDAKNKSSEPTSWGPHPTLTPLQRLRETEQHLKTIIMGDEAISQQFLTIGYKLLPIIRREIVKRSKEITK